MFNQDYLKHTALFFLCAAAVLLCLEFLSALSGMLTLHHFTPHPLFELHILLLKVWLPWLLCSPLIYWFSRRYPVTPQNWPRMIAVHFLLLLTLAVFIGLMLSLHYYYFEPMPPAMRSYQPWQHTGHFLFGDNFLLFDIILYVSWVASLNLTNFYQLLQQQELQSTRLQQRLSEARLMALRMQINPHFLFNTLNTINVMIQKQQPDKASDMLEKLSRMLRHSLDEEQYQWVPLQSEIELIDLYLSIEQMRFGERLQIHKQIEASAEAFSVPPMLLQPLVENAIRHGLWPKPAGGNLTIKCHIVEQQLHVHICDDGVGCTFDHDLSAGIGLNNVRQRLQQLYGQTMRMTCHGEPGRGVKIQLVLPRTPQGNQHA